VRLLALTGMRRSEVLGHGEKARRSDDDGLRWGEVDLAGRAIRLRKAKAGARLVPLGAPAVALLSTARPVDVDPEALVCPGTRPGQAFVGIDKVRARLGLDGGLHSLRRGFASIAAEKNLGEFVIAALLGHGRASVTSDYVILTADRDPLGAVWKAADLVAGEIAAALDGRPPADVVAHPAVERA
jgi:integrase